ncbi:hypothetical protein [Daejeonella sp.]|uniref:hypothetical protein n=1 Tax=Daejeonella sp. TaxID=2805397 RepID=UPI0030C07B1F
MSSFKKEHFLFLCVLLFVSGDAIAQKFLIPRTATIQRAGSIGYNSFGVGYNLFGNKRGSLDLAWGYVPESKGGRQDIFAGKFAYRPIRIKLRDFGVLNLANPGVFVTHHPGGKFHTTLNKDQYPARYYWWSSAVRFHISASTELKINTPKSLGRTGVDQVALYGEFNTNELYAVSWFRNRKQLPLQDIFKLGLGIKAYF